MSSIVSSSASGRRVSARFARFAAAAGFELELARPRSPQTKGKVESSNRFLSRLAVYEGDFRGEEGLAAAIARIESSGLCYGGTYKETNDAKQGTVFKQSAPANTQLTEYSKVYIWVSDGPAKP